MQTVIRQTREGPRSFCEYTLQELEDIANRKLIDGIVAGRISRPPNGCIDPSLYGSSEGRHTKNRLGRR